MHLSDGEVELDALAAFLEAFSDAQYRLHAGRQYGTHLIDNVDVVFGMVFAAFGMPDDDVRAAEVRDHVAETSPVNAPCVVTDTACAP